MSHTQALTLDNIFARRRDVEQQVDQMILQEIHLVDVEKAAVRACQQTRLERLDALSERALEVKSPDDSVLGRSKRKIDDRNRNLFSFARRRFLVLAIAAK